MSAPAHLHGHLDADLLPRLLALDAVVHAPILRRMVAVAVDVAHDVARIVDVGSGTGTGTLALAAAFPNARVSAVDVNEDMLMTVRRSAAERGLSDRVDTVRSDIAVAAPGIRRADLVWSSNAMHEVSDPSAAFRNLFQTLRPGGALLVAEMDAPPLVLPAAYMPLESALRAAAGVEGAAPDWSTAISGAGFGSVDAQTFRTDQSLPVDGPGGMYAALELRRLAEHVGPRLSADVTTALRRLVVDLTGPHQLLDEVRIRGSRTLWTARRP